MLQIRDADDLSQIGFCIEFLVMKFAAEVLGLGLREFRLACQGFKSYHILGIIPCLSLQEGGCGERSHHSQLIQSGLVLCEQLDVSLGSHGL